MFTHFITDIKIYICKIHLRKNQKEEQTLEKRVRWDF